MDELLKIPPVTRAMLGLVGLVTLTPLLKLSDLQTWYLDWLLVRYRHQYWRPVTSFFYAGQGILMLMSVFFLFRNSSDIENSRFFRRSSQYTWCLLVCGAAILALNYPLQTPFLFGPLLTLLIYLWARDNPTGQVNFFGFFTISSKRVPLAYLFMDLVTSGLRGMVTNSTGLLAGHAWLILEALGNSGDAPRRGLKIRIARILTQAPGLLRRVLPDSTDPSTGTPTPTGGPGRRAAYGSAYAPRGGAWGEGGQSLNSPGGGSSAAQGSRFVPSFLRNLGGGGAAPSAGPSRDDLLAATERRLRAQAGGSIVGQNQARAASRAGLATQPSTGAQSTATPAPRAASSGVHSIRQLQNEEDKDLHTASSSGGSVAEQRRGHARQPSDPDAAPKDHWPSGGQRLGE